ncbi:FMN-dependent dehydrogenase [Aspergillus pseudotamarii]|uniref:Oxidase FUB9 n=1 Tax=Aspergillus pseudotamarii TaxID=132259 RepID=A0A5N6T9C2_ASPPS|nr:FMN-dependent dehydrogenase [Aspergillus pseudotamarii]KAE8142945.1 FMN-dependent dehydrogenase [Aspergillus pseudotamarii]
MSIRPPVYDKNVLSIVDLQREASMKLPKVYREYYNDGATDMISLRDNVTAFDRYKIRPRVLVKIHELDTSAELFGSKVTFPLGFSPTALHKLAHPDGEFATSQAAANMGIGMALSSYASTPLEDVAAQGTGHNPYAIQLAIPKDRSIAAQMIRRAEAAGYKAIFLTVDCSVLGIRYNENRNNFALPTGMAYPNLSPDPSKPFGLGEEFPDIEYDTEITWCEAISWVRSITNMKIWAKGIYTPEDVILAIEHGFDGIIISNHGGRQLDGVPATLDVLRECAPIAKGRIPIAIDGGIRRGSDIFKALALGAQHCFVGRVPLWGLAYNGKKGVELAVKILLTELKVTMALAGCRSIKDISRSHLATVDSSGVICKL